MGQGKDTRYHSVNDVLRTRNALSTFSAGMFVHVKCMHVSTPMRLWQVLTSSEVISLVRPPAFLLSIPYIDEYTTQDERRV